MTNGAGSPPESEATRPLHAEPPAPGRGAATSGSAASAAKRALREQRLRGERTLRAVLPTIPRLKSRERVPLSFAQKRIWFFHQLEPSSALYNLPLVLRLEGPLETPALRQALEAIVARHEILRTRFVAEAGEPVQIIDAPAALAMPLVELDGTPEENVARVKELVMAASEQPFDLARDPLLRATLIRRGNLDHVLLLVTHHIAGDGWSWSVFLRELGMLYSAFRYGKPVSLAELSIQYADFAAWQLERLQGEAMRGMLSYWKGKLAGAPETIDLPTDYPRPPLQTFRGEWKSRSLGVPLTEALQALSLREGATLFMTLFAATSVLYSRYAQQNDLVIGAPIAGRTVTQTEPLIGLFVNTLALRVDLSGDPEFRTLLSRVRATALEAFDQQSLPFDRVVEELQPKRRANRLPLVQVAFVLQNTPGQTLSLPDLRVTQLPSWSRTAKFDLTFGVEQTADGLVASLEYNTDLFAPSTAERMLANLHSLLEGIVENPQTRLSALPLVSAPEQHRMLVTWNQTARPFPRDATVHQRFEAQVERCPEAIAVTFGDRQLTYRELNTRSNQLAHRLRSLGVGPDKLVALCLERSPEMIIALLGILKAGGAYVSLDPSYPPERLAFMLSDSRATVLLSADAVSAIPRLRAASETKPDPAGELTVLRLGQDWTSIERESGTNPSPSATAENLAYVSYTSGSTGHPKGVAIPHRAVNRLLLDTDYVELGPDDAVLQIANCAFDASIFEIWGPLLHGGRLVIVPPEVVLSPRDFAREIEERQITVMFVTTALFNQLSQDVPGIFRRARTVLFGGEAVNPDCVRAVLRHGAPERLLHVYGPTETTTFATWQHVTDVPDGVATIPIGRPLANTTLYVLDEQRRPVPIGVPGELYIGGDGLARGYWNQPELTEQKFVPNPFATAAASAAVPNAIERAAPESRLYRTGDRVRWREEGVIEFLGRIDRQIKIRGFRIELGEIEAVLERHPQIRQAVVVARESPKGERRLVAYVTSAGGMPAGPVLREHLRRFIPDYMIPAVFVGLEEFPLNANGKVDRAALPEPAMNGTAPASEFVAPGDDVERRVADIWESVLEVRPVAVHDNFFELGGHSLAGVRVFAGIEKQFGRKLPLTALFQAPTVAGLAALIRGDTAPAERTEKAGDSLVALQARGSRPPLFFVHGAGTGNLWAYANLVPHLDPDQPVYAFDSRAAVGGEESLNLEAMAAHYVAEMRRVQPRGPYLVGGYCFGGNVAYEMACQLEAAGERVALVALLDSAPPCGRYYRIPWWSPVYALRFAANAAYWLNDFFGMPRVERRSYVRRKLRAWARKFRRPAQRAISDEIDIDAIIDASIYTEAELKIWRAHVTASWKHRPKRYGGRVTLFRTRGQPFLCSLDPQFGWGELAQGGVEVVRIPGAHEKIFIEPHVRVLGAKLMNCIVDAGEQRSAECEAIALEQVG